MPKPTLTAVRKKPKAVIIHAYLATNPGEDPEYDFEGFDGTEAKENGLDEFWTYITEWNEQDVADNSGDLWHLTVEVTDTSDSLTLGRVHIVPDNEEMQKVRDKVLADPPTLLAKAAPKGSVKKAEPSKKATVRGRKPSAAAAAIKGGEVPAVAEEKPKTVRKVAAKSGPRGVVPEGTGRAAELKKRLAEKKKAEATSKDAEPAAATSE